MHLIYLAGNSLNNKTWIEKVKSTFDSFSTGDILYYDHWQTGANWINIPKESEKLAKLVKDQKDYFVFAKSIGSVVALKNIFEKTLTPQKLIICGHPYNLARDLGLPINSYLKSLSVPTMFIQNEFDPLFSYVDLENTLSQNPPADYELIKNPGNNTHDYEDYASLANLAKIFFGDEAKEVHLQKIYQTLDILAQKLTSLNINWLLGASGALMVYGINIVPHDLDVLVTFANIQKVKDEFKNYLVSEDDDGLVLNIGGIEVEIIIITDLGKPVTKLFQGNLIPVNTLENELSYYEQRPDKENTIRLIKEKLKTPVSTK